MKFLSPTMKALLTKKLKETGVSGATHLFKNGCPICLEIGVSTDGEIKLLRQP